MTRSIVVDYDLPGSPAKVWRTLTEPELLAAWLMDNDIAPEVGHRFTFRSKPMGDWDGTVQCEVLAVEPQRLLRYSWRGGSAPNLLDSIVTWTLAPTATGTALHLEHSGFPDDHAGYPFMDRGWRDKAARIAELLATL
ncbi:MAG: SRPBCC domain-containing protein [Kofleriaceae bacterium]